MGKLGAQKAVGGEDRSLDVESVTIVPETVSFESGIVAILVMMDRKIEKQSVKMGESVGI